MSIWPTFCKVADVLPTLREVLDLPALRRGSPTVRAGAAGLDEAVRWVHVSEISDIATLLEGGELILTTGIALPANADALQRFVAELVAVGVCGVVVELGRRYRRSLPAALVAAAERAGLPLIELHRETPFVAVTQAVHTLILDARVRELVASDERQRHRTLLTDLALRPEPPGDVQDRAGRLEVPLDGRALTGLAVRTRDDGDTAPALLRDIANRAAESLRGQAVPALVGLLDDRHVVALLSCEHPDQVDAALRVVSADVHALSGRGADLTLVLGAGTTFTATSRAGTTLREAVRVSDTAALLPPRPTWFRPADLRLHGLLHELRGGPALAEYVHRELGPLLDDPALYEVLAAFCRAGGNKTGAAQALFVSRASLYDRLRKIETLLGVDLADPGVVLGLHVAVLAHEASGRPDTAVRPGR